LLPQLVWRLGRAGELGIVLVLPLRPVRGGDGLQVAVSRERAPRLPVEGVGLPDRVAGVVADESVERPERGVYPQRPGARVEGVGGDRVERVLDRRAMGAGVGRLVVGGDQRL